MFFEAAQQGKNAFWRYLVMFVVVFAATNTIGAIPLIVIMAVNTASNPELLESDPENLMDLSVYGIESNTGLLVMMVPFVIGIITLMLLVKSLHGRTFLSLFNGGSKVRWGRILYSALVWLILMGIYLFIALKTDPSNYSVNNLSSSLIWLVLISVFLIPFQTAFEELLFRGYLMQGAGVWFGNKWAPLIITSLLFGLMHGLNPEIKEFGFFVVMPQYITFGLVFGLLVIFDNGIELAIGAHAANNIFLSIFLTQESSALQTAAIYEQKEVYPWADFFLLVIISALFIILMAITYKWKPGDSFKMKSLQDSN